MNKGTLATSREHHALPRITQLPIQIQSCLFFSDLVSRRAAFLAATLELGGKKNLPHCTGTKTSSVLNFNFLQFSFPLPLGQNLCPLPKKERQSLDLLAPHCKAALQPTQAGSLCVPGSRSWSMAKAPHVHDFYFAVFGQLPCQSEKHLLSLLPHLSKDCCRYGGSDCNIPFHLSRHVPCGRSPVREADREMLVWKKWELLMSALVKKKTGCMRSPDMSNRI